MLTNKVPPVPQAGNAPKSHFAYLDGLRACAALYVVLHHAMLTVPGIDQSSGFVGGIAKVLGYGHVAVDLFIVLSGFCLILPLLRADTEMQPIPYNNFYLRRARRILPPYFSALALSLLLALFVVPKGSGISPPNVWGNSVPFGLKDVGLHILLIHDAFASSYLKINYVFWSIAVEWRIYFLFPILVISWIRYGPYITTGAALIGGYFLLFLLRFTPVNTATAGVSPHFLGLFVLGMFAATIAFAKDGSTLSTLRDRKFLWLILSSIFGLMVIGAAKLPISHENQTPFCDLFVGLWAGSLLILATTGSRNRLRDRLGCKPLAFTGKFAYSLYLIHAPLLEVLWRFVLQPLGLSPQAAFALLASVGVTSILLFAYLFFLAFERPFLRASPRSKS